MKIDKRIVLKIPTNAGTASCAPSWLIVIEYCPVMYRILAVATSSMNYAREKASVSHVLCNRLHQSMI